ncbi:MAG: hypothetical protein ABIJ00_06630 [Candidatus Eisenbacteria bacterium]
MEKPSYKLNTTPLKCTTARASCQLLASVSRGNRKRQGDPSRWLGKLVLLGEDGWQALLELVEAHRPSRVVEVKVPAPEVYEDREEKSDDADLEEVAERYFTSLDLPEDLCEDVEIPDWPEGWQEERIWGDLSPEERRSLRRLLGSRAPKWMDT